MDLVETGLSADPARPAGSRSGHVGQESGTAADTSAAASAVTALYQQNAVGLIRLAMVMLGDRAAAEDVVQDAFFGLYRNWSRLGDPANALVYTRSSVLNGCRNALRTRARRGQRDHAAGVAAAPDLEDGQSSAGQPRGRWATAQSAESQVLLTEEAGLAFQSVSAASDDRTFVLFVTPSATKWSTGSWYELRIAPGTAHPAALTRLPVRPLPYVDAMAVSGSGRELAVAQTGADATQPDVLSIYSLATGRLLHAWSTPHGSRVLPDLGWNLSGPEANWPVLTWVDDDRAIIFPGQPSGNLQSWTVRQLDVTSKGGSLAADSRIVWTDQSYPSQRDKYGCDLDNPLAVSPDGRTFVCPCDLCRVRDGVRVDQLMAGAQTMSVLRRIFAMRAAHAGWPGPGCPSALRPVTWWTATVVPVSQSSHSRCAEPGYQLLAGVGGRGGPGVADFRVPVALQDDPAGSCYQVLPCPAAFSWPRSRSAARSWS